MDNEQNRVYGASSTITSCDLPDPHYHFAAREVKYVTKNLMVARPAVLYVADVPVLWLPFIFQDMRHGRHSGLIPPQFGLNDIVRNSPTYHRHISNLGYYWAINDYADAQVTMDWYAQQFITLNGRVRYHEARRTQVWPPRHRRQGTRAPGAATLMLHQRVHPRVFRERLGHANILMTL